VLCIVEAMKLMNEIEAEQPGRLLEVTVQNGSPVEYGEASFDLNLCRWPWTPQLRRKSRVSSNPDRQPR